jgi:outer membrane protein assembly factor BamD (BamD/ComL family)
VLKKVLLLLLSFAFFAPLLAQQTDADFAEHYFNKQEYNKAILYLDKLYFDKKNTSYFDKLVTCYTKIEAFQKAEKLIKQHYRNSSKSFEEDIALAKLYAVSNTDKASKLYRKLSEYRLKHQTDITIVAEFLINSKEYQLAYDFYTEHKSFQSTYNYYLTLARIFGALGKNGAMIDQYLNMVLENASYQNIVKSSLVRYLDFVENEELSELLRISLLKAQQNSKYSPAIVDLLQWYYLQVGAFEAAFSQLKAASKRNGIVLEPFLELAKTLANNDQLKLCYDTYSYLEQEQFQPETQEFIKTNKVKYAYAYYNKNNGIVDSNFEVDPIFSSYITNTPLNASNAFVYLEYADYLFRYKKDISTAFSICDSIINTPNIYARISAFAKIKKADILVVEDNIWEASLLYSQVEKAFKNDDLGSHAKLKNAHIAYYSGDFEWAQAQLDIIKAATSELISNNAIDLSLIITDNLNLDTSGTAMSLYAQADLLLLQNKTKQALASLDSLVKLFPTHSLKDEILWKKFEIAEKNKEHTLAKSYLELLIKDHSFDIYADDAIYNLGLLYQNVFNDSSAAIEQYKNLIINYPNSVFAADARKRLRSLRGDNIKFEG